MLLYFHQRNFPKADGLHIIHPLFFDCVTVVVSPFHRLLEIGEPDQGEFDMKLLVACLFIALDGVIEDVQPSDQPWQGCLFR